MKCRWDRDAEEYLTDGEPCKRDEYGDRTHHCTARRTCSVHVGADEKTCPRCVGKVRDYLRRIPMLAAFMAPVAVTSGVDSEAANLAGPAADYAVFSARRTLDKRWILKNIPDAGVERAMKNLIEDDDARHPYNVLTRWALMIAEDYGHDLPTLTVSNAAEYLGRHLAHIAQDDEQDFPLLASELRKCWRHLESVLSTAAVKQRGAPCPECADAKGKGPLLLLTPGHWCDDPECCREHDDTDAADEWVCPRNKAHTWSELDYRSWVEERATG